MKYRPRVVSVRTIDDVIAAVHSLHDEPLPDIVLPPDDAEYWGLHLDRAFEAAYGTHPAVIEARGWRDDPKFRVLHELAYLPVTAARRFRAAHPELIPSPVVDDPDEAVGDAAPF